MFSCTLNFFFIIVKSNHQNWIIIFGKNLQTWLYLHLCVDGNDIEVFLHGEVHFFSLIFPKVSFII